MYLTVFAPHSLGSQEVPRPLQRLLSAGRSVPLTPSVVEGALCRLFFDLPGPCSEPPVAAVTYFHDTGEVTSAWCLRADPAYLHPRRHELVMISLFEGGDDPNARLSLEEARSFGAALSTLAEDHGAELHIAAPQRWYLLFDRDYRVETTPPAGLVGRNVDGHLPTGPDGAELRVLGNELQMQLHASGLNEAREANGLYPVNSLWLWGGGRLPERRTDRRWAAVICDDDPLVKGLARYCDVATTVASAPEWGCVAGGEKVLWVPRGGPHRTAGWQSVDWQNVALALRKRRIHSLELLDPDAAVTTVRGEDLSPWRRWTKRMVSAVRKRVGGAGTGP